ncbi:MAG: hypothetical protein RR677_04460 [Acinetobacter sp.]
MSIWSIVMMWVITLWFIYLNYEFKHKPEEGLKNDKNIKLKLFLGAFLLLPMVSGLPEKLSILLFYNIEENFKKAVVYDVDVKGYFTTGTSKNGGKSWAYVQDVNDKKGEYVMVCSLISMDVCDLGKFKGEMAIVRLSNGSGYPLTYKSIVYSFRNDSLNIGDNEFIGLYKENKRYISYFLFLIYLPSMFFALVVPRAFK